MRLFLFRHGEVSRSDLFFGQFDNPLSDVGVRQSDAIAAFVSKLDIAAIYTSDLGRAKEVGRRISKRIGLPSQPDPRLREIHLGWADGMVCEEAFEREPGLREANHEWLLDRPLTEGGETIGEVAARVRDFRAEALRKHRGRKVVLVGHNTPNRVLLGDALGLPVEQAFSFRQDFGCANVIEYGESKARVALLNASPEAYGPGTIR
jgi:alpha-ribazole phosphatase